MVSDLAEEIEKTSDPRRDPAAYLMAIGVLGIVVVLVVLTYAYWTATPTKTGLPDIPDALIAIGSAAIGALAGILMPASRK